MDVGLDRALGQGLGRLERASTGSSRQLVSWTFPGEETDGIEARFDTVDGRTSLHVESVEADGSPRDFYATHGDRGRAGPRADDREPRRRSAPGVYEAPLGEVDPGAYAVRVTQTRPGSTRARPDDRAGRPDRRRVPAARHERAVPGGAARRRPAARSIETALGPVGPRPDRDEPLRPTSGRCCSSSRCCCGRSTSRCAASRSGGASSPPRAAGSTGFGRRRRAAGAADRDEREPARRPRTSRRRRPRARRCWRLRVGGADARGARRRRRPRRRRRRPRRPARSRPPRQRRPGRSRQRHLRHRPSHRRAPPPATPPTTAPAPSEPADTITRLRDAKRRARDR